MALTSLRQVLDHAAQNGYGVPAFNVNNMEQVQAICAAAAHTDAPVILQASRGARAYAHDTILKHLLLAAVEMYPHLPIVMHQDHGNALGTCLSAIQNGFTSVMMDGSLHEDGQTPSDYAYNARVTRDVTLIAHQLGVSVEGELGALGSLETGMGEAEDGHGFSGALERSALLTDPDQAEEFVRYTQVDALAVAIGTSHGAYKFTRAPTADILAIDLVQEIHRRLPDLHLVMHGSSSVPSELQDRFTAAGGDMPQTWGVPVAEIQTAIKHGVRKINVDTDCRLAMAAEIRRICQESRREFDPRKLLSPARAAMQAVCQQRYEAFGAAGQASGIRSKPLASMVSYYHS